MPPTARISTSEPSRLVDLLQAREIVDVQTDEDCRPDPRLVPASLGRDRRTISQWAPEHRAKPLQSERALKWGGCDGVARSDLPGEVLTEGRKLQRKSRRPHLRPSSSQPRAQKAPDAAQSAHEPRAAAPPMAALPGLGQSGRLARPLSKQDLNAQATKS